MHSLKRQAGISYWSIMALIMVSVLMVQFAIIAGPAYMDDMTLNKIIEDRLRATGNGMSYPNFVGEVGSQLTLNGLRDMKAADMLTVTTNGGLKIQKKYEVRKNFISNIDIVIHFDKTFDQKEVKAGGV